jgi:circadian clock protein KaiB
VAGTTSRSLRALTNIKAICEEHLHGRYDLQVIDVYQQPGLAKADQVLAIPTLIKTLPAPLQKWIGDLSNTARVLVGLELRPSSLAHGKKK